MPKLGWKSKGLSLGRRLMCDGLETVRAEFLAGGERTMHLADVMAARNNASPRPSWGAIMTKAFALAARNHPQMRQVLFEFPWRRIAEYDGQIASVVVNRRIGDEDMIFLAPIFSPEKQSLAALDGHLRRYNDEPVENVHAFREALRIARFPTFLRRLLWWLSLKALPGWRIRRIGTFGVTTMSPFGAKTLSVPSIFTALLHYGAMSETGDVPVGLVIDHRVMDGAVAGYALMEMEQALHHEIRAELDAMNPMAKAA